MEQSLSIPVTKPVQINSKWIVLAILAYVLLIFKHFPDPVLAGTLIVSIVFVLLIMGNRSLLIFFTALSFYLGQTSTDFIQIFLNVRWLTLATCALVAVCYPVVSKYSIKKTWPEIWSRWLFCAFAFASVTYSVFIPYTLARAFVLLVLFFVISRLIKPFAATYGPKKVVDLLLYAAFPLFLISVFYINRASGYLTNNTTYQTHRNEQVINKTLGLGNNIHGDITRFHGIFQNPNTIGILGALLFPLLLHKMINEKTKFYMVFFAAMLWCLVISDSREGLVACFVSGSYVYFRNLGTQKFARWIFFVFLPLLLLFSPFLWHIVRSGALLSYLRLDNLTGFNLENILILTSGRLEAWIEAIRLIAARPLQGYGYGTEDILFDIEGIRRHLHSGHYMHNSYLGLLLQVGFLGTALFFVPLLVLLGLEIFSKNPSPLRIALQGVLISGLVACLAESWIYSVGNSQAFLFWSCVGLLEYIRATEGKSVSNTS